MYVSSEITEHTAWITIDKRQTMNAVDEELLHELKDTLDVVERDNRVRTVVITGRETSVFVAGGDIQALRRMSPLEALDFVYNGQALLNRIESSAKVYIAAINGVALGGGTELALACDIRIAADNARLGLPEVTIGLYPGWGGTQRLPRLVGLGKAKELILIGAIISAAEAYEIGLVNRVVPADELRATCDDMARRIADNAPFAVSQAKKVMNQGTQVALQQGLVIEAEGFGVTAATSDRIEGLTAFLEKRKPQFLGK